MNAVQISSFVAFALAGGARFCAFETLKAGDYEFDFRIGQDVFSALKLLLGR